MIGPSLGAFIVQYGAWPIVFWMNLPIGAPAIAMIALFLPEHVQSRHAAGGLPGVGVAAAGDRHADAADAGRRDAGVTGLAAIAVAFVLAGVTLVLHERRVAEPMLPLELWRNRVIVSSSIGSLVTGTLMMGVTAYLPTYIQGNMGRGADVSAVILALMSVVWVLGSATAGLCLPHTTYRRIADAGRPGADRRRGHADRADAGAGPVWAGAGAVLIGAGMGFCNTTFMVSVQTSVAWGQRGAATSSTMFLRFLGQSLGAAVFGAVLSASLAGRAAGGAHALDRLMDVHWRATVAAADLAHLVDATTAAMRHAYLLTGTLAVLALLLALTYPRRARTCPEAGAMNGLGARFGWVRRAAW